MARKNIGRAGELSPHAAGRAGTPFSRAELGHMVSMVAGLLDEHIDAVWRAAIDDEFLTPNRISRLMKTQQFAKHLAEAFAPRVEVSL
jgi:hypothetical protein